MSTDELPHSFPPFEEWTRWCGFVPALFRAQAALPRAIEAETLLARAVLLDPGALTGAHRRAILEGIAALCRSQYVAALASCVFPGAGTLRPEDAVLIEFAQKLGRPRAALHQADFEAPRAAGFADEHLLEAILTAAFARFICAVSSALSVVPDVPAAGDFGAAASSPLDTDPSWTIAGPYLRAVHVDASFPPFLQLESVFGFVPKLFRAQTLRPAALAAEASLVESVLGGGALPRRQKERMLLAVAAAHLNTSCAALHAEMLRLLGVDDDACDRLMGDYREAQLPQPDVALLDVALRIGEGAGVGPDGVALLRSRELSDVQILEAILTAGLAVFLTTLQSGLGTPPDLSPRKVFAAVKPEAAAAHPEDPDAQLVGRARKGDVGAFEELVRLHHRRVYRAALAVTGNEADAEDAAQVAFVKAFNALAGFERHARFTTWLTRIAINEALSRVRARRPAEDLPLDDREEGFRPTITGPWMDNPEQLYERGEMRKMIERALSDMPVKYRMAVLLRDVEQLSTTDAAAALGIPVPTLKKHLLRGRLLLREALAPHFAPERKAVPGV